jgi:hypothetical protein
VTCSRLEWARIKDDDEDEDDAEPLRRDHIRNRSAHRVNLAELLFVAALACIPLWPILAAWRRFLAADRNSSGESFQMRAGLAALAVVTTLWLAVFALMVGAGGSREVIVVITGSVSPAMLGFINVLLCAGGLVYSGIDGESDRRTVTFRKAIGVGSACFMAIWLVVLSNS